MKTTPVGSDDHDKTPDPVVTQRPSVVWVVLEDGAPFAVQDCRLGACAAVNWRYGDESLDVTLSHSDEGVSEQGNQVRIERWPVDSFDPQPTPAEQLERLEQWLAHSPEKSTVTINGDVWDGEADTWIDPDGYEVRHVGMALMVYSVVHAGVPVEFVPGGGQ